MARKSRKGTENVAPKADEIVYRTGLYARISEENEKKREADSIGNQMQLLKDYVSEQSDLVVQEMYIDDDITGTNFLRPEFSRMMMDVREGKINCIVVKDLSRFGRSFIETGEYIEMVLPFFGCRFIAINDRFDTKYQQADISVQIKNLANELYAKDISQKIRSSVRGMQDRGLYTGSKAPYGYLLDPKDKHRLIVDEETAPTIRMMFEAVAEGYSAHSVAVMLNDKGIPSPGRLRNERSQTGNEPRMKSIWGSYVVKKMLRNEIYLGWTVSGKTRSYYYETGKKGTKEVPREEWKITKGTHEPIITEDLFNKVQEKLNKPKDGQGRVKLSYRKMANSKSLFSTKLKCGNCGHTMQLRNHESHSRIQARYDCYLHNSYTSTACPTVGIKQKLLEDSILKIIKTQIALFLDATEVIKSLKKKELSKTRYNVYNDQIKKVKKEIEAYSKRKADLYEDYNNRLISRSEYISLGQEYAQKKDELKIFLYELEKHAEKYSEEFLGKSSTAELISKYKDAEELTQEMVDAFIKEIRYFSGTYFEVDLLIKDELDEVIRFASELKYEVDRYAG